MSSRSLLAAIDRAFDFMATESEDAEDKILQEPGFEVLQSLLEDCLVDVPDSAVSADAVSETSIKKVFQEQGWPDNMSFTREELDTLVHALCIPEAGEEEGTVDDMSDIEDPKPNKSVTMPFPLVRPTEVAGEDEKTSAEQCLKLVEKMDAVKVQSYLAAKFQEYLETAPQDRSTSMKQKRTQWAQSTYYKHLRDFAARDCLDSRTFTHRFVDSTFIPMIAPQSFGDEERKRDAVDAIALMKPQFLPALDKELWAEWEKMAAVIDLGDMDWYDSFRFFLDEDYFQVVRKTCEAERLVAERKSDVMPMLFKPMVDPTFGASPTEAEERKVLLKKASPEDHTFAEQEVSTMYEEMLKSGPSAMKKMLKSKKVPPGFAGPNYYKALKERVIKTKSEESGGQQNTDKAGPTGAEGELQQKNVKADSSGPACVGNAATSATPTGIDFLLSGQSFASPKPEEEKLLYKSASEILQSPNEGSRCNYQGLLVVCDDIPREIHFSETSSRKRKAGEGKAADVIFVDKTGAISACLWGEVAEHICSIWRDVQESRERGAAKPCFVELIKVRILGVARNQWHGESITRIRILHAVDNSTREGGTTVKVLEQPTADNLLKMTFAVPPPDCCVTVFRSLRNKLTPPFRLSVKGKIVDLQNRETSQNGNAKRIFDLVDASGLYLTCCAIKHNADSPALVNYQDVVIYFGSGRGAIGSSKAMLYIMKDAIIISLGKPSLMTTPKTEQLCIQ